MPDIKSPELHRSLNCHTLLGNLRIEGLSTVVCHMLSSKRGRCFHDDTGKAAQWQIVCNMLTNCKVSTEKWTDAWLLWRVKL